MNWIILNGKRSTLIKGLIIRSLPPITKPLMRTSVDTIDGRDGDIVRKLGYAAYDKTVEIGLAGDYDVDQVIKYFDSEGHVIFSNEPDKYYRYQVLEAIDFEKLLRFKTATVTFHVQPFKYSAVDKETVFVDMISEYPMSRTLSGITLTCDGEKIHCFGTSTSSVIHTVNMKKIHIENGEQYYVQRYVDGTGGSYGSLQIAGQIYSLGSSGSSSFTADQSYNPNTFFISIQSGQTVDFTLAVHMYKSGTPQTADVTNWGNYISKPKLGIWGSGNFTFSIDGESIFTASLTDYKNIIVDSETLNAYSGENPANRYITGDLKNLRLSPGKHTLSWSASAGAVSRIDFSDYSRWL